MSRRSTKKNAISLFPFLAVLVCTMGALILLLLVTTRRMHKDQQEAADLAQYAWEPFEDPLNDPTPEAFVISLGETRNILPDTPRTEFSISLLPPDVNTDDAGAAVTHDPMLLAEKQQRVEELQQQLSDERDKQQILSMQIAAAKQKLQSADGDTKDYESQVQQLADLRQQERELEERLKQKQLALVNLQAELDTDSATTADAETLLKNRESALVSLRKLAQDSAERAAIGSDKTVVEFTNSTGTRRTPILIDVTAQGFEFLPTGIRVTEQNIEETPDRHNPLVAGVLAIHRHRNQRHSGTQPYVLLLVRPDGGSVFYAAKRSFTEAGLHWGYELLDEDSAIAAGVHNRREAEAVRMAVLQSLNRRFPNYKEYANLKDELVKELAENRAGSDVGVPGLEERFFAGGHAPRRSRDPRNAPSATRRTADADPELPMILPNTKVKVAENSEGSTADDSTSGKQSETEVNPFEIPGLDDVATPSAETVETLDVANADFGGPTGEGDSSENTVENFGSNSTNPLTDLPAEFRTPGDGAAADFTEIDLRELFPERRILSDNLGIGGRRAAEHLAQRPILDSYSDERKTANRTDPREPTRWPDSMTATHGESGSRTAGQAGDFSSAESVGPPDSRQDSVAGSPPGFAGGAERPAGDQGFDGQNEATTVDREVTSGDTGSDQTVAGGGRGLSSDEESFLRKFMQQVEEERSRRLPDPMLVSMLNEARRKSRQEAFTFQAPAPTAPNAEPQADSDDVFGQIKEPAEQRTAVTNAARMPSTERDSIAPADDFPFRADVSTEESSADLPVTADRETKEADDEFLLFPGGQQASPDAATPADAAPAANRPTAVDPKSSESFDSSQQKRVYFVIKVFVDKDELSIGDFEAINTEGWTADQRLALTLEAISATMEDVWANVRRDAIPAVRFLVAPGARDIQATLTKSLAGMEIPTRAVQDLGPGITVDEFFEGDSDSSDETTQQMSPQSVPAEPSPVIPRTRRRTSI